MGCKHFSISKKHNKHCEMEYLFNKDFWTWFNFHISWSRKTDHAGPQFHIELMWFDFCIRIYDTRHWNYEKDRWYFDGEEAEEREETDAS